MPSSCTLSLPVQQLKAIELTSSETASEGQGEVCRVTGSSCEEPPAHCLKRLWILPDLMKKLNIFRDENLLM